MLSLRSALLALLLPMLWGSIAAAIDPRETDILGLRLGMNRAEVAAHLIAQGIDRRLIREERGPCVNHPAASCLDRLSAPTRDGSLLVRFAGVSGSTGDTVRSIAYTLYGRAPGEPAMIRNSVLGRFGPPIGDWETPIWCARAVAAKCNPPDQPRITFHQGPGTISTLTLIDPTAIIRAGP